MTLLLTAFPTAIVPTQVRSTAGQAGEQSEEDELAREVDDPTATLAQLKFQDLYSPQNYSTTAQTNTLRLQPVLPVPGFRKNGQLTTSVPALPRSTRFASAV